MVQYNQPGVQYNQGRYNAETITAVQWATYLGAGFGLGALLWLIAARLYHREQLAISA